MPKEITDVKKFLSLTKTDEKDKNKEPRKGMKHFPLFIVFIKTSKKITKLKLRGKKYLYTFKTADNEKAKKLIQSLPASNCFPFNFRPNHSCQQQEDKHQEEEQEVILIMYITQHIH